MTVAPDTEITEIFQGMFDTITQNKFYIKQLYMYNVHVCYERLPIVYLTELEDNA